MVSAIKDSCLNLVLSLTTSDFNFLSGCGNMLLFLFIVCFLADPLCCMSGSLGNHMNCIFISSFWWKHQILTWATKWSSLLVVYVPYHRFHKLPYQCSSSQYVLVHRSCVSISSAIFSSKVVILTLYLWDQLLLH